MLLIVVLGLIAKLASVSAECDVAKTVQDFDFNKFTGTWYFLYYIPCEECDNIECPIERYDVPVGNSSRFTTYIYDKRESKEVTENGLAYDWDNTGYSVKYRGHSMLSGRTYILAVDYDRYFIGKFCLDVPRKVLIYVAFRSAHPNNATMEDVKKALRDNNIDFNQLKDWNADRCRELSVEG